MKGKIVVELDYTDESLGIIKLSHPDLEGELVLRTSSDRLSQIQLDAINVNKPKTLIDGIVADSQELIEAVNGLKQLVPEIVAAIKGKK